MRGIAVEVGFDEKIGSRAGSLLGLSDGPGLIDGTPVTVGPLDTDMLASLLGLSDDKQQ